MSKRNNLSVDAIVKTIKRIHQIRPQYLPALLFDALLQALRPFILIVFSAKILDELLGGKDFKVLLTLALLLVGLMLFSHIIGGYLKKRYSDESKALIEQYYFALSKKSMKLSYQHIESKETIDLIKQIEGTANSFMAIWNIADYLQKGLLAIIEVAISVAILLTIFSTSSATVVFGELSFVQSPWALAFIVAVFLFGIYCYGVLQAKIGETAINDMICAIIMKTVKISDCIMHKISLIVY